MMMNARRVCVCVRARLGYGSCSYATARREVEMAVVRVKGGACELRLFWREREGGAELEEGLSP
jgi:hypothetical protein